ARAAGSVGRRRWVGARQVGARGAVERRSAQAGGAAPSSRRRRPMGAARTAVLLAQTWAASAGQAGAGAGRALAAPVWDAAAWRSGAPGLRRAAGGQRGRRPGAGGPR